MIEIEFSAARAPDAGALAVLLIEGQALIGLAVQVDEACGGGLSRAMAAASFRGKKGQSCLVLAPGAGLDRVVLVGMGKPEDHTLRGMEEAGGVAAAALLGSARAALAVDGMPAEHAAHAGLGAMLRSYRFDRYRTKEAADAKPKLVALQVLTDEPEAARAAWAGPLAIARGSALTRDLVSEPPNVLNPAEMAERCRALSELGVEVEVLGPAELEEKGFGALLGVSQGSACEPRVVVMQWKGGADGEKPVCFVGKGVTFDTGGISIKPAAGMGDMKWDMAGAGAVVGAMAALAGRKARANVVGLVGLSENMPSGTAQRPGDVVRSLSGQTIEVLNTDAEGRLVLADVIWYAQDRFDPVITVNLATLTGAIITALGSEYGGMFCNDDALATRLLAAGAATGEKLWRMPLAEAYDKLIRSDIADMKNIGGRPAGAIIGAQFIQRFVRGPWRIWTWRAWCGAARTRRRSRRVRRPMGCGCWTGWWRTTTRRRDAAGPRGYGYAALRAAQRGADAGGSGAAGCGAAEGRPGGAGRVRGAGRGCGGGADEEAPAAAVALRRGFGGGGGAGGGAAGTGGACGVRRAGLGGRGGGAVRAGGHAARLAVPAVPDEGGPGPSAAGRNRRAGGRCG